MSKVPVLLIVTGPPAAGKSTTARQLAELLNLPWMSKDRFKEALFDSLGWGDRLWSQKLGAASMGLLYDYARSLLRAGRSCLIESNFRADLASGEIRSLQGEAPFLPVQVLVTARTEVLVARWQARVEGKLRHPGHLDGQLVAEFGIAADFGEQMKPLEVDGPLYRVDTSEPDRVDLAGLADEIRPLLPAG